MSQAQTAAQRQPTAPEPHALQRQRARTLISTAERLSDVLCTEATALRAMRFDDAAELNVEKSTLLEVYDRCMKDVVADGGLPEVVLDMETRSALRHAGERLIDVTRDSERTIKAMQQVNERVLAAIIDAAREQRVQKTGYGANGVSAAMSENKVSLALDRSL